MRLHAAALLSGLLLSSVPLCAAPATDSAAADAAAAAGRHAAAARLYARLADAATRDTDRARFLLRRADALASAGNDHAAWQTYETLLARYALLLPLDPVFASLRRLADRFASGASSPLGFRDRDKAIAIYEAMLKLAPMQRHAPDDMLQLAAWKAERDDQPGALTVYRDLMRRFPRSDQTATARLRTARLLLAEARLADGDGRRVRQARSDLRLLLRDFPDGPGSDEGKALLTQADEAEAARLVALGRFYLRRYSYRPEAARRYLFDVGRKFPQTAAARDARQTMAAFDPDAEFPGAGETPEEAVAAAAAPEEELPPQPVRLLQTQEAVPKWLLPLEDYSDYLPQH